MPTIFYYQKIGKMTSIPFKPFLEVRYIYICWGMKIWQELVEVKNGKLML